MDELGGILREARESRGLTLEQAQAATRINRRFLEALEAGAYRDLPTPVHVRGFLRNYARYLNLDPQPLLDRYQALENGRGNGSGANGGDGRQEPSAERPIPPRADNPFFNPVNMEIEPTRSGPSSDSLLRVIVILALLLSIALVASRFFLSDGRQLDLREAFNTLVNSTPEPAVDDLPIEEIVTEAQATAANPLIIDTGRNQIEDGPTILPTPTPLPPLSVINLKLEITERTWLQITVDGEVTFEGQATSGQTFDFTANRELQLKSGNAKGVFATINDTYMLGRLGQNTGDVFNYTWTTTNQ